MPISPYLNNPERIAPINVKNEDDILAAVDEICGDLSIISPPYEIRSLSGGLSNRLFVVNDVVLVRIHGAEDELASSSSLVDREAENQVSVYLAKLGIGPTIFGRFQNGRLEEFYSCSVTLTYEEMPIYSVSIAKELAKIHKVLYNGPSTHLPSIVERVDNWIASIFQHFEDGNKSLELEREMMSELLPKWTWLKEILKRPMAGKNRTKSLHNEVITWIREEVFCHMDLQSLNLLKPSLKSSTNANTVEHASSSLKVIDFEYAGFNTRAADIANTFCEFCDMNNLCADYKNQYPSDKTQNEFLAAYIEYSSAPFISSIASTDEMKVALSIIRQEIGRFTLSSHLGWAIWSILQRIESPIEFDFYKYAKIRMDGFEFSIKNFDVK